VATPECIVASGHARLIIGATDTFEMNHRSLRPDDPLRTPFPYLLRLVPNGGANSF
jgi:hypothetical protein